MLYFLTFLYSLFVQPTELKLKVCTSTAPELFLLKFIVEQILEKIVYVQIFMDLTVYVHSFITDYLRLLMLAFDIELS